MKSSDKLNKPVSGQTRREFFRNSMLGSAGLMVAPLSAMGSPTLNPKHISLDLAPELNRLYSPLLDLTPAKWIWYPSQRTLQNSVFLFRKTVHLDAIPSSAKGWILADSRYKLYVNGEYVQFGPAPFDPRQPEADPVDITKYLKEGENIIGAEVLYYGTGEGTWPAGKPGFIANIELNGSGGQQRLITDDSWMVSLADSWKPGQFKRWYLRAFQEEFDARRYPYGWNQNGFELNGNWLSAMIIDLPADKSPISSPYDEYQQEIRANPEDCNIRQRSIPLMKEFEVRDVKLSDRFGVTWKGDHYLYSGNSDAMHEVYPRLLRFCDYVISLIGDDGLLPVEDLGVTWVWMDTDCYARQQHKQCSFNLYSAAMMMNALAPMAKAFGDVENADMIESHGKAILDKTIGKYWDNRRKLFVDNLPWAEEEGGIRLSDRTLSMALIYDMIPGDDKEQIVEALGNPPNTMGLSFPANAIWRLWALGKAGKTDVIINEIRERWYAMNSVQQNNTLQEHWSVQPDTRAQWSHCAMGPLFAMYNYLAGIEPLEPGMSLIKIKPKPGSLEVLNLDYHTPDGKIEFRCSGNEGDRRLSIRLPDSCEAVLIVDKREDMNLQNMTEYSDDMYSAFRLEGGESYMLNLSFT